MDKNDVKECVLTAQRAGSPTDQTELFLSAGYIPYPWQWKFHADCRLADYDDGPVDIGLGGARGPGKSHAVLSQAALDDCQRVEGLKVLFLRQTGTSARESFDDLVSKTLRGHIVYYKTLNSLRFDNGSRIILGGFKDERDIDKYIGIEYDLIIVEELTQLTQEKYEKLRGSLRTSKPNWRPRMYTSFNPGGRGHTWVKERYIIPNRENTETTTRFIGSTYKQNPALNKEYIEYLEGLQGDLGRAWREGDWDLFEGQYFDEWRRDKHVCKPFTIPPEWLRFYSIDPSGRSGITACHWYALDRDGRVYCVAPETKILKADLHWVEAGTIEVGDVLAGFDEHIPEKTKKRKWKKSIVENVDRVMQPCYRLTLDDGKSVVCSGTHKWLAEGNGRRIHTWKTTEEIKVGWKLLRALDTWEHDTSWGAGYLAGAFDGEGHLTHNQNGTVVCGLSQKDNALLYRVRTELEKRGFKYAISKGYGGTNKDVFGLTICRKRDVLRLAGSIRPERLWPKVDFDGFGGVVAFAHPRIVKKEYIGMTEVVSIQTSSRTYIAEGLLSHNCYREHYATGMDMDEHAERINKMCLDQNGIREKYQWACIDSAAGAKAGYSETGVEIYQRHGIGVDEQLIYAPKDRVIGWNIVHQYLRVDKPTGINSNPQPMLKVFDTCVNLIRTIPALQHDELHPEDVDSKGEDHAADELRYFLRTLREGKAMKAENAIEKRIRQMNEMDNTFNYNYSR